MVSRGFIYRSQAWHYATDQVQLSFCPENTKFGIGFAVKYLTLALFHKSVLVPATFIFEPFKNNSWICAVRISPRVLDPLVSSGFDVRIWDCPPAGSSPLKSHLPVYFGGPDHRVIGDATASSRENQAALLTFLKDDGVTDLSEEHAKELLHEAFTAVAEHGIAWAEHVTIETAYELMRRHPADGTNYVFDAWLPAYARATRGGR